MKTFLAVYTGTTAGRDGFLALPKQEQTRREAEGMAAWGAWMEAHADAVVDNGAPLGVTKRITKDGIADTHNTLAAYVTVRANSHVEAARMFENHPHFSIFPGDGVEVMECLPLPGRPEA